MDYVVGGHVDVVVFWQGEKNAKTTKTSQTNEKINLFRKFEQIKRCTTSTMNECHWALANNEPGAIAEGTEVAQILFAKRIWTIRFM